MPNYLQSEHLLNGEKDLKTATRFKIVGTEVIGLGSFLLVVLGLQLRASHFSGLVQGFGWDYGILGGTFILIGLEILSLVKNLPAVDKLRAS
jgi:hypothetical protein